MNLLEIAKELSRTAGALRFGAPITHVYNPLDYAWEPHSRYLERFGKGLKKAVLVGMNPGPFGMAQTGVPFGEVSLVRDWMGIHAKVDRPTKEHPKRPVEGFACRRSEVSGRRFWGWARDRFGTPERFFDLVFVHNFCPLAFMEESGRNRTPDKIPPREREPLLEVCNRTLVRIVELLEPEVLVGIGAFAEKQVREALEDGPASLGIDRLLHPSPASPLANRRWDREADACFRRHGLLPWTGE